MNLYLVNKPPCDDDIFDLAEFVPHLSGVIEEALIVTDIFIELEIITENCNLYNIICNVL